MPVKQLSHKSAYSGQRKEAHSYGRLPRWLAWRPNCSAATSAHQLLEHLQGWGKRRVGLLLDTQEGIHRGPSLSVLARPDSLFDHGATPLHVSRQANEHTHKVRLALPPARCCAHKSKRTCSTRESAVKQDPQVHKGAPTGSAATSWRSASCRSGSRLRKSLFSRARLSRSMKPWGEGKGKGPPVRSRLATHVHLSGAPGEAWCTAARWLRHAWRSAAHTPAVRGALLAGPSAPQCPMLRHNGATQPAPPT